MEKLARPVTEVFFGRKKDGKLVEDEGKKWYDSVAQKMINWR
jgi:hypothetical protein